MRMLRIAYLISRYPAISHTFILREVTALRRAAKSAVSILIKNLKNKGELCEQWQNKPRLTM